MTDGGGSHDGDARRGSGSPAIHGVLVTYRRPNDLAIMLGRLAEQKRGLDTLVIVDNDPAESAREAAAQLQADDSTGDAPPVTYIASGSNLGPAGGIALGMRHVLRHAGDDDWVLPIDDDNPPRLPDLLAELERFGTHLREREASVGAVGLCGGRFDVARARGVRIHDAELTGAVRSDWIGSDNFPLYSIHAVRAVGLFDSDLFFGFDDLDYGLRLGAAGYGVYAHGSLWHTERAFLGHLEADARPSWSLDEPTWRHYYSLRNLIYILRKGGHRRGAAHVVARGLAKPVVNLPRGPVLAGRHLALNSRAILDAYRGRMGRTVSPVPKS